ncbi:MAG: class I SAM-dependent methyltransferase [Rhodospirillales bacterium]|nr:class I SAM-dependent methyltransferase [Rhodospirillales bacterium]
MPDQKSGKETAKLHKAYQATNTDELAEAYDDWADEYEDHMKSIGYTHPAMVTSLAAQHIPADATPILDAGCGTGIMSEIMQALGHGHIVGLDASPGMLKIAGEKAHYEALHHMYLGEKLDFETDTFEGVVSSGVFTQGHAPLDGLDELIRVTKPGGRIAFSVARTYLEGLFDPKRKALEDAGLWRYVDETGIYNSAPLGDHLPSRVYCFEVV